MRFSAKTANEYFDQLKNTSAWTARPNMRQSGILTYLVVTLFLSVLAVSYQQNITDDSYLHFQRSVMVLEVGDWGSLTTDLWNKPLPALLYGVSGQWGLTAARLISVILTVLTALLIHGTARHLFNVEFSKSDENYFSILALGFFVFQQSVLPQSFQTMTELPAAFLLSLGLWLLLQQRIIIGFFVLGIMPFARVEAAPLMAIAFLTVSVHHLRTHNWNRQSWRLVLAANAIGALPFICWQLAGYLYTGQVAWFLQRSYAYLRPLDWDVLSVNAFTAMPSVLSGPLLFMCIVGIWRWPKDSSKLTDPRWPVDKLVLFLTVFHFCFVSAYVVYPEGGRSGPALVAAINARNFNVISPLLALLIYRGAMLLLREQAAEPLDWRRVPFLLAVVELSLIGFLFLELAYGSSWIKALAMWGLHNGLLVGLLMWVFLLRQRITVTPGRLAAFAVLSFLLTTPLFWYPLKFQDYKFQSQQAICERLRAAAKPPARVIQDVNASLANFCNWRKGVTDWTWPVFFESEMEKAPAGAWIIVETDRDGSFKPRYSDSLQRTLRTSDCFKEIEHHLASSNENWLEQQIGRISGRNEPTSWSIFEKKYTCPHPAAFASPRHAGKSIHGD